LLACVVVGTITASADTITRLTALPAGVVVRHSLAFQPGSNSSRADIR
jgi:hypothetical protein